MNKSYSQLLNDIESGEIITIIFIQNRRVLIVDFINGDSQMFERGPIEKLTARKELMAFQHSGFWQCMDTMRDKNLLNYLIKNKRAPWIT